MNTGMKEIHHNHMIMVLWPDWLYKYPIELPLGESIESDYLTWNSEQHRLTPTYDILRSLVNPVKQYFVTMEEDEFQFKINCQRCNCL